MLSTEGKIVSKYYNISKPPGRGSINPPPPRPAPFYHDGGMTLRVRPKVKLHCYGVRERRIEESS